MKLVEIRATSFKPLIEDRDPFFESDGSDPDDEADEAQDRANGLLPGDG